MAAGIMTLLQAERKPGVRGVPRLHSLEDIGAMSSNAWKQSDAVVPTIGSSSK